VLSVAGATLAVMASITRDQAAILVWIVESGEDTVVLAEGPGWATLIAESLNLDVNAADVRELEAQGLIRVARGHVYDLTNAGRAAYVELTSPPPPERPEFGFRSKLTGA
jgi:DNA-binding MarR family transcriptional regulator